jgi:hypothetical protein
MRTMRGVLPLPRHPSGHREIADYVERSIQAIEPLVDVEKE